MNKTSFLYLLLFILKTNNIYSQTSIDSLFSEFKEYTQYVCNDISIPIYYNLDSTIESKNRVEYKFSIGSSNLEASTFRINYDKKGIISSCSNKGKCSYLNIQDSSKVNIGDIFVVYFNSNKKIKLKVKGKKNNNIFFDIKNERRMKKIFTKYYYNYFVNFSTYDAFKFYFTYNDGEIGTEFLDCVYK